MESAQHAIIEYSMEQFGSKADFLIYGLCLLVI